MPFARFGTVGDRDVAVEPHGRVHCVSQTGHMAGRTDLNQSIDRPRTGTREHSRSSCRSWIELADNLDPVANPRLPAGIQPVDQPQLGLGIGDLHAGGQAGHGGAARNLDIAERALGADLLFLG